MEQSEIWTVGHSNKTLEAFLGLVHSHRIEVVADVRRFPGSRRHPQFNSEQLSPALAKAGVNYLHIPELGGRREVRKDSVNTAWKNESFRGYADFMDTEEFHSGIRRLLKTSAQKRTAIMCAEALWWQCHRSLIADFLKCEGVKVWHISSETKVEEHPLTSPARIVNGTLTYTAPETVMELDFSGKKA
jgi:uncharacterized protein (DUF488 family)